MDKQTVCYLFNNVHEEEATTDEKFCKRETGIVGDDVGATTFHNLQGLPDFRDHMDEACGQ
jgi:hypothetical protein